MAGLAAGVVSAAVGVGVSLAAPAGGKILAAGVAVVAAGCAVIAFGVVAYLLDRGDLKVVLGLLTADRQVTVVDLRALTRLKSVRT